MNISRHHKARENMTTRRQRRAWEAVFILLTLASLCMAACAIVTAIAVGLGQ